jgi:hypothetical protein
MTNRKILVVIAFVVLGALALTNPAWAQGNGHSRLTRGHGNLS